MSWPSRHERERLERFPVEIALEDLRESFTLKAGDRDLSFSQHGPARLGVAVALCALRFMGFVPADLASIPEHALLWVCDQLDAEPTELLSYGARAQTRSDDLAAIRAHLGFRIAHTQDLDLLARWLVARALEHDAPSALFSRAAEHLLARRIVRPTVDQLARMIATAREAADYAVFDLLAWQLDERRQRELDRLLVVDERLGVAPIVWLREQPHGRVSEPLITRHIARFELLEQLRAGEVDLCALPPSRQRLLAARARRMTPRALRRMGPERRYPILLAFLAEAHIDRGDELISQYENALAGRKLDELRKDTDRDKAALARLGVRLSRLVLDAQRRGEQAVEIAEIERAIGLHELKAAVESNEKLQAPAEAQRNDKLHEQISWLQKTAGRILRAVPLCAHQQDRGPLDALELVGSRSEASTVPDAPLETIAPRFRDWVLDDRGRPVRARYELALMFKLKDCLRDGTVWRSRSRRYADPATFLMPREQWEQAREEISITVGRPLDPHIRLEQLQADQEAAVRALQHAIDQHAGARIENGKVIADPVEQLWLPPEVPWLDDQIEQRIPLVELVDPLIDVNSWIGFAEHFVHAGGARRRMPDFLPRLFAVLIAYATNLGLHGIAAKSSFSYAELAQLSDWYLTEEALRAAIADVVAYQHQLELASNWGDGTFSMSDAQRLEGGATDALRAAAAREFGYRRGGVSLLSWVSDMYAIYGQKIVTLAGRESTYTLDEIAHNPILEIERHTTDTYGSTDLLFALFDLIGKTFHPRIRDLQSHVDYRLGPGQPELQVDQLLLRKRAARPGIIIERWEEMQRAAASLIHGWATSSMLISRLQAQPQQNPLAEALIEYGRILRTNHGLWWRADPLLRRDVGAMLNKGEKVHDLRQHIRFGRQGQTHTSSREQHELTALCLALVMNCITSWSARYQTAIIDRLERDGHPVSATARAHISAVRYAHVNQHGRYRFHRRGPADGRAQLRRLRPANINRLHGGEVASATQNRAARDGD
jgi:TnpA family transposase